MFVYVNSNDEIITVAEKDILHQSSYAKKYEIPDSSSIPYPVNYYRFIDGQFVLRDDVLNIIKNKKITELTIKTQQYIYRYYPEVKQKSDIADESYFTHYVKVRGINELEFRQLITQAVLNIYKNNTDFSIELNSIYKSLNVADDDKALKTAIEQLLKVAVRVEFIQRVKAEYRELKQQIYRELKQQIEKAGSPDDADNIEIKFNTKWVSP